MYIVRQNTSLLFQWHVEGKKKEDDWITINDNGVESVTHMYTETLLVLIHNVASFPLESFLNNTHVYIRSRRSMMHDFSHRREKKKKYIYQEDSLLHFYLFLLV